MANQPQERPDLTYAVDEAPPVGACLLLAGQHLILLIMYTIYAVILVNQVGGTPRQAQGMVTAAIIVCGLGTVLQALTKGPVGSGYLGVHIFNPIYLPLSIQAYRAGGPGLLAGMTALAGACSCVLARLMHRLRFMFPPEVCGVVVATLGLALVRPAIEQLAGYGAAQPGIRLDYLAVGLITLAPIVGLAVWGKGKLRLYSFLIGLGAGYAAAWYWGLVGPAQAEVLRESPWLALPMPSLPLPSLDLHLVIPFVVAALVTVLDTSALIITSQKNNNAAWKRPDMKNVGNGVMAEGISTLASGLAGGMATAISSASVGLTMATSATSRRIAWYVGGMALVVAFVPKLAALISSIPNPCTGAILLYTAAVLITAGTELIASRMLDARRIFMVGFSIAAGISAELTPWLYDGLPPWIKEVTSSPLTVAGVAAMGLNLLFRLGVSRRVSLQWDTEQADPDELYRFMEHWGGAWGARREVVRKATSALVEACQCLALPGWSAGPLRVTARYDEFNLDLAIAYQGRPLDLGAEMPTRQELLEDDSALERLSCNLIARLADKASMQASGTDRVLKLHFVH